MGTVSKKQKETKNGIFQAGWVGKCVCASVCVSEVILFSLEHSKHFEGIARLSHGCLFEVSRMFQGSFKGVSRKIEGSSESHLGMIQGSFKVCKRSSNGV